MYGILSRAAFEPVKSLAFGSIGAAYMGVGTAFSKPIRILILQNLTDGIVWFSFDGVNDHVPLASISYIILDLTSNKGSGGGWFIDEGTRVYVKQLGAAPTSGSVYVSALYGKER